jgi:hypothetical protein
MMYRGEAKQEVPAPGAAGDCERTRRPDVGLTPPTGWDPFEIWRERIKEPREQSGQTTRSDLDRARPKP